MKSASNSQKVTIEEALRLIDEAHGYKSEDGKNLYTKRSIYNRLYENRLRRFGPKKKVLLDPKEVIAVFGPGNNL